MRSNADNIRIDNKEIKIPPTKKKTDEREITPNMAKIPANPSQLKKIVFEADSNMDFNVPNSKEFFLFILILINNQCIVNILQKGCI